MGSTWDKRQRKETRSILNDGSRGVAVDDSLARSDLVKVRRRAALHSGLRHDPAVRQRLLQLMRDPNAKVRATAVANFAATIHPAGPIRTFDLHKPADKVPADVLHLLGFITDPSPKVRATVLHALQAYLNCRDPRLESTTRTALGDPVHKIQHIAASHLHIKCPGCGSMPKLGNRLAPNA